MNEKDIEYLRHISDEIDFLFAQCENLTFRDLTDNDVLQRASVRSLEVIGEAVKNLSDDYKEQHPSVEWKKIAGFRDILIHHYFGIDLKVVWDVIKRKLPLLEKVVKTSIKGMADSNA